jgi:hypothetical protein
MNYRPLGRTGWRVSDIRFGARPSAVLNNFRTAAEATRESNKKSSACNQNYRSGLNVQLSPYAFLPSCVDLRQYGRRGKWLNFSEPGASLKRIRILPV